MIILKNWKKNFQIFFQIPLQTMPSATLLWSWNGDYQWAYLFISLSPYHLITDFQYNRDGIVGSTAVSRLPRSIEMFSGRPIYVTFQNVSNGKKTSIDLHRLLGEATKILNLGPASPIFCENHLKKMSLAMKPTGFDTENVKVARKMTQKEVSENWEYYFISVAKWLTHFDEFKKLSQGLQVSSTDSESNVF